MALARIKRSTRLVGQAWRVLRSRPSLLLFPIASLISSLGVLGTFALPIVASPQVRGWLDHAARSRAEASDAMADQSWILWALLAILYFVLSFVTIFFNAALLGVANRQLRGEDAGIAAGFGIAISRLPQILGWTFVSTTVGMLLRWVQERFGLAGRLVGGLGGLLWTVVTYFVLPALVVEGVGPMTAITRSSEAIRRTWGESLVVAIGFGALRLIIFLACMGLFMLAIFSGVLLKDALSPTAAGMVMVGGMIAAVILGIFGVVLASTLRTIVQMALYRYAIEGAVAAGFEEEDLRLAFRAKG
ncbi:MAG: hypothetical protein FJ257_09195 [Phycisphaerae bacterium]|nr:hypothetical protein [Phycisphaerae bacterium]